MPPEARSEERRVGNDGTTRSVSRNKKGASANLPMDLYAFYFQDDFFFSSRRRHTSSVSAFLLNRSSDLNKTRDGLIRVRNIRALNGRFNTSITHAYSIVIGSKHITLNATGGGFLTASKQFRHGATSKSRSNTASNSTKHKSPHLSGWRQISSLIT